MVFSVKGRVALVTGGTEGIGLAVVERLLDEGARVIIANRNVQLAEKVVPELRAKRGLSEKQVSFVRMDVCDLDSVRSAFKASLDFAGADGLSIVVANAGFTSDVFVKDLKTGDDSGWINGVQGNVIGTFLLARLSLSYWLEKDMRAAFVVTSSVAGMHGMYSLEGWRKRGHSSMIYGAVKAAQVAFVENTQLTLETRAKTKKMPRAQQRFTAVLPGAVFTNIWRMSSKEEVIKAGLTTDNWVPMEKLVDSFMRNITDEDRRGSSWVVAGSAGDEVRYPDPPVVSQEKYYRRAEDDRAKL